MEKENEFIKVITEKYYGEKEMILNIKDIASVEDHESYSEIKLLNGNYITVLAKFEELSEAINPKKIVKSGNGRFFSLQQNTI
ncbi:hypothetical protein SDC9_137893 [bioreactor metagenome]|uniref:Uncharacterized protein n=1 Tax=bioreactor metagenome TaxID=1076179 RepID=A0A645DNC7_9ZZZZ|nr:hypothetical protein [Proteiniphilum sp.]MEA4918113.1 hypothetical protein [Proteiniphilum sp.]